MSIVEQYDITLKDGLKLEKGKHSYTFNPSGLHRGADETPVFYVDGTPLSVRNIHNFLRASHLVCGCEDYNERERRFYAGETYKKQQKGCDFGWDCVATCHHIELIKRYFARPVLQKVLDKIKESESEKNLMGDFLRTMEAQIFPHIALDMSVDYLDESEKRK